MLLGRLFCFEHKKKPRCEEIPCNGALCVCVCDLERYRYYLAIVKRLRVSATCRVVFRHNRCPMVPCIRECLPFFRPGRVFPTVYHRAVSVATVAADIERVKILVQPVRALPEFQHRTRRAAEWARLKFRKIHAPSTPCMHHPLCHRAQTPRNRESCHAGSCHRARQSNGAGLHRIRSERQRGRP